MSSAISLLEATANVKSSMDALSLILSAMILFASMVLPLIFFNWRVSSARPAARTPLEVLQEEMAEMKRQIASRLLLDDEREAFYSELTARFKSSKDELATARGEIAELKALLHAVIGKVGSMRGVQINKDSADENSHLLKNYIKAHLGGSNVDSIYMG